MKIESKIKKVQEILKNIGFNANEANQAIEETNKWKQLSETTPKNFVEALLATYNVNGVQR